MSNLPLRTTKKTRRAPAVRIFSSRYCETAFGRPRSASGSRCTPIGSSSLLHGNGASRVARPAAAITPTTGKLRSEDIEVSAAVDCEDGNGSAPRARACGDLDRFALPCNTELHRVHSVQRLLGFGRPLPTIGSTLQAVVDCRADARQARSATSRRSRSGIRQGGAVSGTLPVVPPDGPATRADL